MSDWVLVMADGSRHPVTGDIGFEVKTGTKMVKPSTIDGDPEVLFDAALAGSLILASSTGIEHRVSVAMTGGVYQVIGVG